MRIKRKIMENLKWIKEKAELVGVCKALVYALKIDGKKDIANKELIKKAERIIKNSKINMADKTGMTLKEMIDQLFLDYPELPPGKLAAIQLQRVYEIEAIKYGINMLGKRNERMEPFLKDFGIEWDNLGYTKNHHEDGAQICSIEEINELTELYYLYKTKGLKVNGDVYFAPTDVSKLMAKCYHVKTV